MVRFAGGLLAVSAGLMALAPAGYGAQLGGSTQLVLPEQTRQIVSIDYRHIGTDAGAQQVEGQVLPTQMLSLPALLTRGGVDPAANLDRLTFATYQVNSSTGIIGVAEGNFKALQLNKFFVKTAKNPNPEQYNGVSYYNDQAGLVFFEADPTTIVFGSLPAVKTAIDTEQDSIPRIDANPDLGNLIAGTQTTDVWSVLDAAGSRMMVHSLMGQSPIPGLDASVLDKYFNGARYTLTFGSTIQFNLELVTTDPLGAATISTGLRMAIDLRTHQETNPAVKAILNQVEVDSAGDSVFMQLTSTEDTLLGLLKTDLMQQIVR